MEPKVKIWVAFGEQTKFGEGRARLFELIDQAGSINKAVKQLGMSYRMVWGYIRELEAAAGFPVFERTPKRGDRGGTRLTAEGRALVDRYWGFHRGLERAAEHEFARGFGSNGPPRSRPSAKRRR
jgi:molybdate transport system regulatory protein